MPSSSGLCGLPGQAFADIHAAMTKLVRESNPSLIVLPDPGTNSHRNLIVELAAPYHLPAIHALRAATVDGALMSYGVDLRGKADIQSAMAKCDDNGR